MDEHWAHWSNNRSGAVTELRSTLCDYFVGVGAVTWQKDRVLVGSYPEDNSNINNDDSADSLDSNNEW